MRLKILFFMTIVILFFTGNVMGESLIGISGGVSKAIGDESEYFKLGFNGAFEFYKGFSKNLYLGGRVQYNHFGADENEILKDDEIQDMLDYLGIDSEDIDISASVKIIEISPSIRYMIGNKNMKIFGQAGIGYYLTKAEVKMKIYGYSGNDDTKENKLGMHFGGGIITNLSENLKFSISPLYHMIFRDGDASNFFSINAGFVFVK